MKSCVFQYQPKDNQTIALLASEGARTPLPPAPPTSLVLEGGAIGPTAPRVENCGSELEKLRLTGLFPPRSCRDGIVNRT